MSNIQDVRAINNPQMQYMYEVDILGLSSGSLDNLTLYCKTVSIPQSSVEQTIINHKASKTHFAGRDASGHQVTITFWDDEALTIYKYFSEWFDLIHNPVTGSGLSRDLYAAEMVIRLKDKSDQTTTGKITLGTVFPTDIPDVSLSYDTSEAIEISITLSFDEKTVE